MSDASQDAAGTGSEQASTSSLPSERAQAKEVKKVVQQQSDVLQDAPKTGIEQTPTISLPSECGQAKELKEAVQQPSDSSQDAAATSSGQTERSGQLSHGLPGTCAAAEKAGTMAVQKALNKQQNKEPSALPQEKGACVQLVETLGTTSRKEAGPERHKSRGSSK